MNIKWRTGGFNLGMRIVSFVLLSAAILLGCSGTSLLSITPAVSPTGSPEQTATLENTPAVEPTGIPRAVLQERRQVSIEWPEKIRLGDSDIISLTLEMDETGTITPTAVIAGHQITGTPVEIPDLYDTHNLVAEARLDLVGVNILPQGVVQEPLRRGQTLHFYWSVQPQQIGRTRGTLWLFLDIIPKAEGETDRMPLLAKQLEFETVSVLGMHANLARWSGAIGITFSVVLGFPFLESLLAGLWKKLTVARRKDLE